MDRWIEEETLVKHEMVWTTNWFKKQADLWRERSKKTDGDLPLGHKSYAAKQQKLWNAFHAKASERFHSYL
jgi:hypothetical protein